MSEHLHLDTQGLLCPLPVIRTQDTIKTMTTGDKLTVIATDPGTQHDIPAWCRVHGHNLVTMVENNYHYTFEILVIQK